MKVLSPYALALSREDKERYVQKLNFKDRTFPDPYCVDESVWVEDTKKWPYLEWPNIYHYFVHTVSLYTKEEICAYRSLEAYNYVKSGHVNGVHVYTPEDAGVTFVRGAVMPSQRLSKNMAYIVWAMIESAMGVIICGHCTCMAGAGEACSHIAAVLILMEMKSRFQDGEHASTSNLCQWTRTTHKVDYSRNKDIEYSKPKLSNPRHGKDKESEVQVDYSKLKRRMEELSDLVPDSVLGQTLKKQKLVGKLPKMPTEVRVGKPHNCEKHHQEFKEILRKSCTLQSLGILEEETREQVGSVLWKQHRLGRLTASKFFDVICRSNWNSTVAQLLEGSQDLSHVPAISYGKAKEGTGLQSLLGHMQQSHISASVSKAGLCVRQDYPLLGASPDGWATCECCSPSVVEVKCSYKHSSKKADAILDLVAKSLDSALCVDKDMVLKKVHPYYYQIQGQLFITKAVKCYFVLYFNDEMCIIQNVFRDEPFIQAMIPKLLKFVDQCLVPALMCPMKHK